MILMNSARSLLRISPSRRAALGAISGLALSVGLCGGAYAGDWVDDWTDQAIGTGPTYLEGQKRGYLTAGSLSARYRMTTDNLMTVSAPRIETNCGGIDMFLGGISFLNADYLVSKLESILQAAPVLAFNMALSAVSKELTSILSEVENIANALNSMQLDDCKLSNMTVKFADKGFQDPKQFGQELLEVTGAAQVGQSIKDFYYGVKEDVASNGGTPPTDGLAESTDSCPLDLKELFKKNSLIRSATEEVGLDQYEGLIRGFYGDLIYNGAEVTGSPEADPDVTNIPVFRVLAPCEQGDASTFDDFLDGRVRERPANGGACVQTTGTSVRTVVQQQLAQIADAIRTNSSLTLDQQRLASLLPNYVLTTLQGAVYRGTEIEAVIGLTDYAAAALAQRMMADLIGEVEFALIKTEEVLSDAGSDAAGADKPPCNFALFSALQTGIGEFRDSVAQSRIETGAYYQNILSEYASSVQVMIGSYQNQDSNYKEFISDSLQTRGEPQ